MRNKRSILVMMFLLAITMVWAEPIGESQARKIAADFMANRLMRSMTLRKAHKAPMTATESSEKAAYYVFNADQGGYVIVAGDDRAPSVLGYSENGVFDTQDVPDAMQSMLDGFAAQIAALEQGAKAAPQHISGIAIQPLVKAEWSQNAPFNINLPTIPSGNHAYVGCVATALAQVMYYWKWPARPTRSLPAYTSESLSIYMPILPVVNFNWNAMQDTYETSDTQSNAAQAVATLCQYCAQALRMDFKEQSSGTPTSCIPNFAAAYFDYAPSTHIESRNNYSTQDWSDLIYKELGAGRPVIYSGNKKDGGHAFICDGFDGNGMFHINWGWNGSSSGYFLLSVLNPDEQGTGSASGAYGYIMDQYAIVGFQPNNGSSHNFEITATDVTLNSYTNTRSSTNEAFKINVSGVFHNYTSDTLAVRVGWGLFKDGEMVKSLYNSSNQGFRPGFQIQHTNREFVFGAGITSGTYRLVPMYSEYSQYNWRPCVGAERNYIEVTFNGNQCTITGYGTAGTHNYVINNIAITGNMHNGRPVNMDVNLTNKGHSSNELLYMFVDGQFAAAGFVGLESGETDDIHYTYLFQNAGSYTLTWSWSKDGSNPVATRNITIKAMPAANLSATIQILDVTDTSGKVITSDKFSIVLNITNKGNTTYDEDISAKLFKHTSGSSGSTVQGINRHLTLAPGKSTKMQFDMTNVSDGWKYFIWTYFYSEGQQTKLKGTTTYTIVFPEVLIGDVNGDSDVNIADVTALVNIILGKYSAEYNLKAADVNQDGLTTVADVTALVNIILGKTE